MVFARFFPVLLIISGCAAQDARHVPANPLLLPVYGASAAFDNASYTARRNKVETYVQAHHPQIMEEITTAPGPYLAQASALARVSEARHAALYQTLREDAAQYNASPEALVVALMVHGN